MIDEKSNARRQKRSGGGAGFLLGRLGKTRTADGLMSESGRRDAFDVIY